MSKRDELRILRRQTSADAPINIHGRTGESTNAGSMLDLYVHSESPEEIILGRDEIKARARFQKGFELYLNRIFDEREREFLQELLHGTLTLKKMRAAFGVNPFEVLKTIQNKAYKNAKPLIKIAQLSGWEGATDFISDILQRLQQLQNGAEITDIIPQYKREEKRREKIRLYSRIYRNTHLDFVRRNARKYWRKEYARKWDEKHIARLQDLNKKFVIAFEALSKALVAWIEKNKPYDGELYTVLNEKNEVFACVCKELKIERRRKRRINKRMTD